MSINPIRIRSPRRTRKTTGHLVSPLSTGGQLIYKRTHFTWHRLISPAWHQVEPFGLSQPYDEPPFSSVPTRGQRIEAVDDVPGPSYLLSAPCTANASIVSWFKRIFMSRGVGKACSIPVFGVDLFDVRVTRGMVLDKVWLRQVWIDFARNASIFIFPPFYR